MSSIPVAARQPEAFHGILLMCLGVAMFPFLNSCAKALSTGYPAIEVVWARFAGHLVVMAIVFLPHHGRRLFAARRPAFQIARSLLLMSSTLLYVIGIAHVPLATASAIGFTGPIIVTALSVPLLGEAVGPRRWAACCIGFLGALVIIRPGLGTANPADLFIVGSSSAYALYQIATRRIGTGDSAETGIVYTALGGTVACALALPFDFVLPRSAVDAALFAGMGVFGGVGHYFVIKAFQCAPAALISPLGYLELVGSTIIGYVAFDNFPDGWTWVGAAIIIASGVYIAIRERRRRGG